jgi:hypothetical protein
MWGFFCFGFAGGLRSREIDGQKAYRRQKHKPIIETYSDGRFDPREQSYTDKGRGDGQKSGDDGDIHMGIVD